MVLVIIQACMLRPLQVYECRGLGAQGIMSSEVYGLELWGFWGVRFRSFG